jgi:cobalt-precorrin 5A hydrolase/precorrin-3B C17-methyltransferase
MSGRHLALGVGCERDAAAAALQNLVTATLAHHGISASDIAVIASLDTKAGEDAVRALGSALNIELRFFTAEALLAETERLDNPSDAVFRAVGCYGVAEGAALAAAGARSKLIVAKQSGDGVTCAIAGNPA